MTSDGRVGGQFTAGSWSYRSEPRDDWGIVRAGRFIICQARDPNVCSKGDLDAHRRAKTDPWEANARLIAAAPDLYEALRPFVDLGPQKGAWGVISKALDGMAPLTVTVTKAQMLAAVAALAKAGAPS